MAGHGAASSNERDQYYYFTKEARSIEIDGQAHPYYCQTFWAGLTSVAHLPSTVIPAGVASDGLPVGLQIVGPAYSDLRTIALARRLEAMGLAFTPPPALGG